MTEKLSFENSVFVEIVIRAEQYSSIHDNLNIADLIELLKSYTTENNISNLIISDEIIEKFGASLVLREDILGLTFHRYEILEVSETIISYLVWSSQQAKEVTEEKLFEMLSYVLRDNISIAEAFEKIE